MAKDPAVELSRISALLEESRACRYDDPRRMVYLAELARAAADRLSPEVHGQETVSDTRARVWAELGNAYRLADALDLAEYAFEQAVTHFEEGTRDPSLLALIAERLATLLCHLRRFPEALALLDRVYEFYLAQDDRHTAGRTLVIRGLYTENSGDPDRAIPILCKALDLLDPGREPSLTVSAVHNLLWCLTSSGRFGLVRRLLRAVRPIYDLSPGKLILLRRTWLEAKVAAGLDEGDQAEALFAEIREGFLSAGLVFPASLVALDLAHLWLDRGDTRKIRDLAEELLASFRALRVGREALVALMLLRRACERRAVMEEEVRSRLRDAYGLLSRLA